MGVDASSFLKPGLKCQPIESFVFISNYLTVKKSPSLCYEKNAEVIFSFFLFCKIFPKCFLPAFCRQTSRKCCLHADKSIDSDFFLRRIWLTFICAFFHISHHHSKPSTMQGNSTEEVVDHEGVTGCFRILENLSGCDCRAAFLRWENHKPFLFQKPML